MDTTFAKSGYEPTSIVDIIGYDLPPRAVCEQILDSYFDNVHWFSLIIYEPRFRERFSQLLDVRRVRTSENSFLLLALTVLAMGSWYDEKGRDADPSQAQAGKKVAKVYLRTVRGHLMDIMGEESLDFIRICTLVGSHDVYHGRPKSSFALLGASIKTAQAMNLHRRTAETESWEIVEERSRVWWTLYTWDR